MLAVFLALGSAIAYGVGDFLAGWLSRRIAYGRRADLRRLICSRARARANRPRTDTRPSSSTARTRAVWRKVLVGQAASA